MYISYTYYISHILHVIYVCTYIYFSFKVNLYPLGQLQSVQNISPLSHSYSNLAEIALSSKDFHRSHTSTERRCWNLGMPITYWHLLWTIKSLGTVIPPCWRVLRFLWIYLVLGHMACTTFFLLTSRPFSHVCREDSAVIPRLFEVMQNIAISTQYSSTIYHEECLYVFYFPKFQVGVWTKSSFSWTQTYLLFPYTLCQSV